MTSVHNGKQSYLVDGPQGTLRRNLCRLPISAPESQSDNQQDHQPGLDTDAGNNPSTRSPTLQTLSTPGVTRTRSGREILKPQRQPVRLKTHEEIVQMCLFLKKSEGILKAMLHGRLHCFGWEM